MSSADDDGESENKFIAEFHTSSSLAIQRRLVSCRSSTIMRSCETQLCWVEGKTGLIPVSAMVLAGKS